MRYYSGMSGGRLLSLFPLASSRALGYVIKHLLL